MAHADEPSAPRLACHIGLTDRLSSSQLTILNEAARVGVRQGIAVPVNVPGEPEGSISYVTCRCCEIGRERMMMTDTIDHFAFDAARRLTGLTRLPDPVSQSSSGW